MSVTSVEFLSDMQAVCEALERWEKWGGSDMGAAILRIRHAMRLAQGMVEDEK